MKTTRYDGWTATAIIYGGIFVTAQGKTRDEARRSLTKKLAATEHRDYRVQLCGWTRGPALLARRFS